MRLLASPAEAEPYSTSPASLQHKEIGRKQKKKKTVWRMSNLLHFSQCVFRGKTMSLPTLSGASAQSTRVNTNGSVLLSRTCVQPLLFGRQHNTNEKNEADRKSTQTTILPIPLCVVGIAHNVYCERNSDKCYWLLCARLNKEPNNLFAECTLTAHAEAREEGKLKKKNLRTLFAKIELEESSINALNWQLNDAIECFSMFTFFLIGFALNSFNEEREREAERQGDSVWMDFRKSTFEFSSFFRTTK